MVFYMKKIFFILTTVFFFSLNTGSVLGQTVSDIKAIEDIKKKDVSRCEDLSYVPEIVFKTSYGELRYDFSHNQDSLTKLGQKYGIVEQGLFASGLAVVGVNWEISVDTISRVVGGDDVCVIPVKIDLFIGYNDPIIYISKDLKPDTCNYDVVLRHEQTHQQINKTALEHFIPKIRQAVEKMSEDIKPIKIQSLSKIQDASNQLTDEFARQIGPLVEFLKRELQREHAKLDSHDNYELEDDICAAHK